MYFKKTPTLSMKNFSTLQLMFSQVTIEENPLKKSEFKIMKKLILVAIFSMLLSDLKAQEFSEDKCVGGVAYASSVNTSTNDANKAFDDITTTPWVTSGLGEVNHWISYNFNGPKKIKKIRMYPRTGFASASLFNFFVEGSNNSSDGANGTWTTIASNLSMVTEEQWSEFAISNNGSYTWYRLSGTGGVLGGTNYVHIAEIEMMERTDDHSYDFKSGATLLTDIHLWASADAAYSNVGATGTAFDDSPDGGYHNVWFKFQASTNEIDIKVLSGGSKGTLSGVHLALYNSDGTVVSNFRTPGHNTAYINKITLTVGSVYYISVDDVSTIPGTFTLEINDHVGYDMRAKAEFLTNITNWSSADAAYSSVGATGAGFDDTPDGGYHNVWFAFQAMTNEIDIKVFSGGSKGTLLNPRLTLFNNDGSK